MNQLRPSANVTAQNSELIIGRKKVTLAPGHSLMDWIRLGRSGDLSGVGSDKRVVTPAELALHNTQKDMWMCLRGKVYNVTPYQDYHPGGIDELMKAAGRDGTALFDEIHNWVNVESMLEKCFIGQLEISAGGANKPGEFIKPRQASLLSVLELLDEPNQDWYQNNEEVIVIVYTKFNEVNDRCVIVDITNEEILIQVVIRTNSFFVHFCPHQPVSLNCSVTVSGMGKVEVFFEKKKPNVHWTSLGKPLSLNNNFNKTKAECKFRYWTVKSNTAVTHDTRFIHLLAPPGFRMATPIGYHIHIKAVISGMEISRSYTAVAPSLTYPFSDPENLLGRSMYLMVKRYSGGALSPWLCDIHPGEKVLMSNYDGDFVLKNLENTTYLAMFAAGTGFTSMINLLIHALYKMCDSKFPVKLMFYNKAKKDILWHDELNKLQQTFPTRFSVTHVLSRETDKAWKGLQGRVCEAHVKSCVAEMIKTPRPFFCICGPWAYNDSVESLAKLSGLSNEQIYIFTQNY
ncbi:cytochrome b5 reductase 4-like isoform X1 [Biomphalaria pfeifferi]|uniref:Cytochrome b5 reductase 4 n=1 Tax=Biomphalaria pfeifferi TaxID=112525 RepID=A0AAD8FAT6_BIOPF|nr:cytochrome b5 reductase 4-like isoform X1 [Biomphalaria pfeifferi]